MTSSLINISIIISVSALNAPGCHFYIHIVKAKHNHCVSLNPFIFRKTFSVYVKHSLRCPLYWRKFRTTETNFSLHILLSNANFKRSITLRETLNSLHLPPTIVRMCWCFLNQCSFMENIWTSQIWSELAFLWIKFLVLRNIWNHKPYSWFWINSQPMSWLQLFLFWLYFFSVIFTKVCY